MTSQEKAKELIRKYYSIGATECKQCALIAVDEILDNNCGSTTDYGVDAEDNELYMDEYFWMEVKEELKKL